MSVARSEIFLSPQLFLLQMRGGLDLKVVMVCLRQCYLYRDLSA